MALFDYLATHSVAFIAAVFILGLLVGSFLNVVIYRLPVMMQHAFKLEIAFFNEDEKQYDALENSPKFNLATPDSSCPHCQHKIRSWENIPVISWLLLRAKCSSCSKPISARYPAIELISGVLSAVSAWYFGWGVEAFSIIVFFWLLIVLTMIDFDHKLLPDSITLPLIWIGLLVNLIYQPFTTLEPAVIGAIAGYMSLWTLYWTFKLITGKEGMGYGDFKLFAAFGAWFGWQALPLIILLSSLVGAVVGILMIVVLGRDKQIPIPFGPYLCGAALVYVFWGERIMNWYLGVAF
jgi:leader peptidase (prepilin peptidase)/N-methyltransferase